MRVASLLILILLPTLAFAQDCNRLLAPEELAFARIVHQKNTSFQTSQVVMREQARLTRRGQKLAPDSFQKIIRYFDLLERVQNRAATNQVVRERLRRSFYKEFVIEEEEIPDSYFRAQQRIAQERGHGLVEMTPGMRKEAARILISDQESSLDSWFDYFLSEDANVFPFYIKYWAFTSMLRLGKFDLETAQFFKRSAGTAAPFPELNREALAVLLDHLPKALRKEALDPTTNAEGKALLEKADFGKLYARELTRLHAQAIANATQRGTVDGVWVKYPRGSDPLPLVKSLEGKNTGWCTAGEKTAEAQLQQGDFHIFYSIDSSGKPTQPRVAIRMNGDEIGEIRGVAEKQNFDAAIASSGIVKEKLREFGSKADAYQKKDSDMLRLTEIEKRIASGLWLSNLDLRFLYELDTKIEGFGQKRDPRIDAILAGRNTRTDLMRVYGLGHETEVGLSKEDFLRGGVRVYVGDLYADGKELETVGLPEVVRGNIVLRGLTNLKKIRLPKMTGKHLTLMGSLENVHALKIPSEVTELGLVGLRSARGLRIPEGVESVEIHRLPSARYLRLPNTVSNLFIEGLASGEGLHIPKSVESLYLKGLASAQGLTIPESVSSLTLDIFNSAVGLRLPKRLFRLSIWSLTSAEGIQFPKGIQSLTLNDVTSADGLLLPEGAVTIGLSGLQSTAGLHLPNDLSELILDGVTSWADIQLPRSLKKLSARRLRSVEKLRLPEGMMFLDLARVESVKGLHLPENLSSLSLGVSSAKDLHIPESVFSLCLERLKSADGLVLPTRLKFLTVPHEVDLKGVKLPENLKISYSTTPE